MYLRHPHVTWPGSLSFSIFQWDTNIFQYQSCDLRIKYLEGYYEDDLPSFLILPSSYSSYYNEEDDVCQMDLGNEEM